MSGVKTREKHSDISNQLLHGPFDVIYKGVSIVQSPGEHRFPLNFILPQRIPSSYKNSVRYSIKAVMDRPPRKFDCVSKIPFFVSTVADLNDEDAAEVFEGEKNYENL